MSKQIAIRVDEWCDKIEVTQDGTFIYVDEEEREEVLGYLKEVLSGRKY